MGALIEQIEGAGEGEIGVGDPKGGGGHGFEGGLYENRGGLGGAGESDVPGVGDEGKLAGAGVFESSGGGDFKVGVALEGCSQMRGEDGELHGGIVEESCRLQVGGCQLRN